MSLDRLDTPLRLTWDLGGAERLPDAALIRLAERIVAGQVFFLTLSGADPGLAASPLLEKLATGGCQVSLVAGGELPVLPAGLPLARLLLDAADWVSAAGIDAAGLEAALDGWRAAGYRPDLLLVPRPANLARLPELVRLASRAGVPHLKLPNLPLVGRPAPDPAELVGPAELAGLRERLQAEPLAAVRPVLEIHDLFLWELLTPETERSGYSGCQAGNSVGHLDPAGILHPCSSWPAPLGSLLESPLYDLWQSAARSAILARVAAIPEPCGDCGILPRCLGGCRGLGLAIPGAAGRDPMCKEIR